MKNKYVVGFLTRGHEYLLTGSMAWEAIRPLDIKAIRYFKKKCPNKRWDYYKLVKINRSNP